MTTDGLVIPSGLRTREIELDGHEAGLKNARPAKRFRALILNPISLSENDDEDNASCSVDICVARDFRVEPPLPTITSL
jgi:hypothetical protein